VLVATGTLGNVFHQKKSYGSVSLASLSGIDRYVHIMKYKDS
jgi:hypothetical protein